MQVAASQRMVQVNGHFRLADAAYTGIEALSFCIHQWDNSTLNDVLAVKLAVNLESLFGQSHHLTLVVNAVCVFFFYYEIKRVTFIQVFHVFLKFRKRQT